MTTYGIIGKPLAHSFSPAYFNKKFFEEKTDARFEAFELESIEKIKNLIADNPNLKGLSVTIPYKEAVIPYLDEIDDSAKVIGAVNCVQFKNGKLKGFNTDIIGFEKSLKPLLEAHHSKALILGTGGASKAVAQALEQLHIPYTFVSRGQKENVLSYESLTDTVFQQHSLIVNTTPLGTYPAVTSCPALPYDALSEKHLLYDLVYNPAETQFMKNGIACGCRVKNGYEMLVIQAEENWKIWNENG